MSRTSLHRPRRNRAVWDRPATGTRLLPNPHSPTVSQLNPHYTRCPKAHRLRLRSDQSLSLPVHVTGYGRSPDIVRLALSKGNCRIGAPLTGRSGSALGASKEPKYPGLRLRAITPLQDYTVVPLGDPLSPGDGSQLPLPPPLRVAERNSPSPDSTVVALGEAMPHSDGRESTPPYLRMAGHFWWSRLPHTEITSRLLHVLSEARGCRRAGVDVEHPLWRTTPIGTGVAVFLRNRPGPSIPSPSRFLRHSCGDRSQMRQGVNPSPEGQGPRSSGPTLPFSSRDDRPVAQGVGAPSGASTPLPTHERNHNLPCPSLLHRRLPHPRKMEENFPGEQSYRHELSIESIKSPHRDNPLTQ